MLEELNGWTDCTGEIERLGESNSRLTELFFEPFLR
jgi:hypothetical protein